MVRYKRRKSSSGRSIFEKKYPQPMTHYEREQYCIREKQRKDFIDRVVNEMKSNIDKFFRKKRRNRIHPQS